MPKTVLIAESNRVLKEALEVILTALGFTVVGKTSRLSDVESLVVDAKPDLFVFDLDLPDRGKSNLDNLRSLKEQMPETKILGLGFHEAADEFVEKLKDMGLDEYLTKFSNRSELVNIINILFP